MNVSILVVDDDADKLRRILNALSQISDYDAKATHVARDINEAKRLLRDTQYDLLVLDIALPSGPASYPRKEGGLELLAEILERDVYKKPREVVGLTAFAEVRENASRVFAEDLWSVIQYDATSETWAEQLKRKIQHISLSKRIDGSVDYESYMCVITALRQPELTAVLDWQLGWKTFQQPRDSAVYYKGTLRKGGETPAIVATAAPRMGMTAAAITAMKLIDNF